MGFTDELEEVCCSMPGIGKDNAREAIADGSVTIAWLKSRGEAHFKKSEIEYAALEGTMCRMADLIGDQLGSDITIKLYHWEDRGT